MSRTSMSIAQRIGSGSANQEFEPLLEEVVEAERVMGVVGWDEEEVVSAEFIQPIGCILSCQQHAADIGLQFVQYRDAQQERPVLAVECGEDLRSQIVAEVVIVTGKIGYEASLILPRSQ